MVIKQQQWEARQQEKLQLQDGGGGGQYNNNGYNNNNNNQFQQGHNNPQQQQLQQQQPSTQIQAPTIDKAAAPQNVTSTMRSACGKKWVDTTLLDFPPNDYRLFVGDLSLEATLQLLEATFAKYTSFVMGKIIVDKLTGKNKGYGFISFLDPSCAAKALREMNGVYVAGRPIRLKRGEWNDRELKNVRKKKNR